MNQWGKIAIAMRLTKPDPLYVTSLCQMLFVGLQAGDQLLQPSIELPHHYAADMLLFRFLKTSCDSVLFIDDDTVFASNTLELMRNIEDGKNYGVLKTLIASRRPPCRPVLNRADNKQGVFPDDPDIIPVTTCGLAFTLIRREAVVSATKKTEKGSYICQWGSNLHGEDTTLFKKITDSGYKLGVCSKIRCGHRFPIIVDYDAKTDGATFTATGYCGTMDMAAWIVKEKHEDRKL